MGWLTREQSRRIKHNEEHNNLYISANIGLIKTRKMRQAEACRMYVEMRNAYEISVKKPEAKKSLGRPGSGWEDSKL